MNRRDFLKQSALVAGASFFGGSAFGSGVSFANKTMSFKVGKKRPNFVFILIDDMGWRDVGWGTIETNNAIELYDLEADIGEQDNRAHSSSPNYNPTKRNELLNDLIAWQNSVGAPNSSSDMPANPGYSG